MKRIARVILSLFIVLMICLYSCLPAFADTDTDSQSLIDIYTNIGTDVVNSMVGMSYDLSQGLCNEFQDVSNMSGDEFYAWYNSEDPTYQASLYWWLNRYVSAEPKYGGGRLPVFGVTIPNESEVSMDKAHYNAAFIDKSFLDYIDNEVTTTYKNGIRYTSLDDIHITTNDIVSTSNIDVVVRNISEPEVVTNMGSKWSNTKPFDVYYDFSRAKVATDRVSIYVGGDLPPFIYIPPDCTVYQNGVALASNNFYIVLGDNELYYSGITYFPNGLIGFHYYNTTDSTDTLIFETSHLKIDNNSNNLTYGMAVSERRSGSGYIYSDGAQLAQINRDPYKGWVMVDKICNFCGYYLDIDGSISETTALPSYVPYDPYNVVVVLVSDDGDNIYYMNPTEYNNYVTNGDIIEGDYVNRYNTTTNNDIVNNYNDYVTNINNGGSGGTGSGDIVVYDDTNLLAKLDTIIVGLNNIYNTIVNFNFFNFNFTTNEGEELPVLSNRPIYDDFSDCITDHITLVSDVLDVIESMEPEVSDNQLTFSDMSLFSSEPVQSGIWSTFNTVSVDLSWYEDYRASIRNLLKIPCYILGLCAVWAAFRQIFGVKPPGGDY